MLQEVKMKDLTQNQMFQELIQSDLKASLERTMSQFKKYQQNRMKKYIELDNYQNQSGELQIKNLISMHFQQITHQDYNINKIKKFQAEYERKYNNKPSIFNQENMRKPKQIIQEPKLEQIVKQTEAEIKAQSNQSENVYIKPWNPRIINESSAKVVQSSQSEQDSSSSSSDDDSKNNEFLTNDDINPSKKKKIKVVQSSQSEQDSLSSSSDDDSKNNEFLTNDDINPSKKKKIKSFKMVKDIQRKNQSKQEAQVQREKMDQNYSVRKNNAMNKIQKIPNKQYRMPDSDQQQPSKDNIDYKQSKNEKEEQKKQQDDDDDDMYMQDQV